MQEIDTDERLKSLKALRSASGLSLDFWDEFTEGLDQRSLDILVGKSLIIPKYMNSNGSL